MTKNNEVEVVTKVLEEMERAEKNLLAWNASWTESYDNICVPEEYWDMSHSEQLEIGGNKYFEIDWYKATTDSFGYPLKVIPINDYYDCSAAIIHWDNIRTRQAIRDITFSNDGKITFSKSHMKKCTTKRPRATDYKMKFDVSSDDFEVITHVIGMPTMTNMGQTEELLHFALKGDIVVKKYNNITIVEDMNTGLKQVSISQKYDPKKGNVSVTFDALLTADCQLEKAALMVQTHKRNGKVNGTYRLDVSKEKGVRANFYSRKGVRSDLASDPLLLDYVLQLVRTVAKKHVRPEEAVVVGSFMQIVKETIANDSNTKQSSFNTFDLNMEALIDADIKVATMLKGIKGEIPIVGLTTRIDNYFEKTESKPLACELESPKKLKLDSASSL